MCLLPGSEHLTKSAVSSGACASCHCGAKNSKVLAGEACNMCNLWYRTSAKTFVHQLELDQ